MEDTAITAQEAAEKLQKAVATAQAMFASNTECLANIVALKRAKEEAEAIQLQLARDANVEKDKFLHALAAKDLVIAEQKLEIERLKTTCALTGAWAGLLSSTTDIELPQCGTSNGVLPMLLRSPCHQSESRMKALATANADTGTGTSTISDNAGAAAALCMLSTHIAKEVIVSASSSSSSSSSSSFSSSSSSVNSTMCLPSDSLILRLLESVWVLQGDIDGRLATAERQAADFKKQTQQAQERYADLLQHIQLPLPAPLSQKDEDNDDDKDEENSHSNSSPSLSRYVQFFFPDVDKMKKSCYSSSNSNQGTPIGDYKSFMRAMNGSPRVPMPMSSTVVSGNASTDDNIASAGSSSSSSSPSSMPTQALSAQIASSSTPLRLFHDIGSPVAATVVPEVASKKSTTSSPFSSRYAHVASPVRAYIRGYTVEEAQAEVNANSGTSASNIATATATTAFSATSSATLIQNRDRKERSISSNAAMVIENTVHLSSTGMSSYHSPPFRGVNNNSTPQRQGQVQVPGHSCGGGSASGEGVNSKNTTSRSRSPCEMSRFALPIYSSHHARTRIQAQIQPSAQSVIHAVMCANKSVGAVIAPSTPNTASKSSSYVHASTNLYLPSSVTDRSGRGSSRSPSPRSTTPGKSNTSTSTSTNIYSPHNGKMYTTMTQSASHLDTSIHSITHESIQKNHEKNSPNARVRMVMHHGAVCATDAVLETHVYADKKKMLAEAEAEVNAGAVSSGNNNSSKSKVAFDVSVAQTTMATPSKVRAVTVASQRSIVTPDTGTIVRACVGVNEELERSAAVSTVIGCDSIGYISDDSIEVEIDEGAQPVWPTTPSSKKTNPLAPHNKPDMDTEAQPVWPTTPSSKKTNPLAPHNKPDMDTEAQPVWPTTPSSKKTNAIRLVQGQGQGQKFGPQDKENMNPQQQYRPLISPEAVSFYKTLETTNGTLIGTGGKSFVNLVKQQHPAVLHEAVLAMNVIDDL